MNMLSCMHTRCVPSIASSFVPYPLLTPSQSTLPRIRHRLAVVFCGMRELRERIHSVKSMQKITEAMKLVAAARVRRAQEAAINSRPFAENLLDFLFYINEQLQLDGIEVPLTVSRPVRNVAIVVVTGDQGLCGGFNNAVIRKAENRVEELKSAGIDSRIISVGRKGNAYFMRRPSVNVDRYIDARGFPTAKEAQVIADNVSSMFVSEEVDKVELVYTKFLSLVKSEPVIHTLLPLSPKGEVRDVNGNCIDADGDEFFRLTTKEGKLAVERERFGRRSGGKVSPPLIFEQDPVEIVDAMMPLYLNSLILRALQESIASELAARMNAMSNATDNAVELKNNLSIAYNRERQAKITAEILEVMAAAEALTDFD